MIFLKQFLRLWSLYVFIIEPHSPNEPTMSFTTEGCFCPDGMKLFNKESGICVEKCGKYGVYRALHLNRLHLLSHSWSPTELLFIFQQDVLILRAFLARWAKFWSHAHLKSQFILFTSKRQLIHNCFLLFQFNERFEYKCQDCICDESTKAVICKPKTCPAPPITNCTGAGFVLVNQTDPANPCCFAYVCRKKI